MFSKRPEQYESIMGTAQQAHSDKLLQVVIKTVQ